MRSLWLNYELSLFIYDEEFASQLSRLQHSCILEAGKLDPKVWAGRSVWSKLLENVMRLMSPLL